MEPEDDFDEHDQEMDHEKFKPHHELDNKFRRNPKEMSVKGAKRLWFAPRKSGRPSREISERLETAKKVLEAAGEPLKRILVRKTKSDEPRRPRGRPKKPISNVVKEIRPRGRPRKPISPELANKPKLPRGRPRKHPISSIPKPTRPRGRPRKNPNAMPEEE